MTRLIYLGQPFTHSDPEVRAQRLAIAKEVTASLMDRGYAVFSPIVHGASLEAHLSEEHRTSHTFWMRQCISVMRHCDELCLLPIRGWRESKGLAEEITLAKILDMPITFVASSFLLDQNDFDFPTDSERDLLNWKPRYA